jgi:hypothetical protein
MGINLGDPTMKIHFALFCFIGSGAVAHASTSAIEFVEDKPDRLYVASDALFTEANSENRTCDNQGGISEAQLWHHDDYYWVAGVGGDGSRQDIEQSNDWDSEGWLWGSTNSTSSVMHWGTNGSGTEIYTANDGSTATYPISLPLLTSEHCVLSDFNTAPATVQDLGDGNWATNQVCEERVRYAQTRWRLQTGGRGKRSSLFRFSVIASQIMDKMAERPFSNDDSRPIAPQSIAIMGHGLCADTNLWMVLPDGTNLDVTPFVAGTDFYRMDITSQKYTPSITVNGVSLEHGSPEFCAGQHLNFELILDPPAANISQMSVWNLSDEPVNEGWQESTNGSVNYRFNSSLLSNLTTSCWYPSGGGRIVGIKTTLQFANGQYCLLDGRGAFSIAKPSFVNFDDSQSLVGFEWSAPVLQANMQWGVTVQSDYDGNVGVTQLISGTNFGCNTSGTFRLDGTNEIYNIGFTNLTGQPYSATNLATHTFRFVYTRSGTANPTVDLTASFKDYLRFRPAGNENNIWVTVATNMWSMDGSASVSSGITRSNMSPAGALVESDAFPCWTDQL